MVRIPVCRSTRVVLLINTTQNPFIKLHTYTGTYKVTLENESSIFYNIIYTHHVPVKSSFLIN
ncbi:hypothetical protein Hanom_Chr15g01354511 [Helianthus anomalus]